MRFTVRFLNLVTKKTERHTFEADNMNKAFKFAKMHTEGKDIQDFGMWSDD